MVLILMSLILIDFCLVYFLINAILQYAWHKVLSVYGNTQQRVVESIESVRNLPVDDIKALVRLCINTLSLVVDHGKQKERRYLRRLMKVKRVLMR